MPYSRFSEELYNTAKSWASRWTQLAKEKLFSTPENGVPKPLTNVIKVSTKVERKSAQRFALVLTARGRGSGERAKYGHGAAIAGSYEYGAREHKILAIPPKKWLSFYWEKAEQMFIGASVNHPGHEAADQGKGYIYWSRYELLKQGRAELTERLQKAILDDVTHAFKSGRKSG